MHKEQHDALEKALRAEVDVCVAGGCEKIITFARPAEGHDLRAGLDDCEVFLKRVKGYLEDKSITLCLENTNSKYPDNVLGRPDQLCDRAVVGLRAVQARQLTAREDAVRHLPRAGQDGNVVATIKDNIQWIAHFHTAGVPGRHEIDDTQELNYRLVAQTIADLGFSRVCRARIPADAWPRSDQEHRNRHGDPGRVAFRERRDRRDRGVRRTLDAAGLHGRPRRGPDESRMNDNKAVESFVLDSSGYRPPLRGAASSLCDLCDLRVDSSPAHRGQSQPNTPPMRHA